MHDALCSAHSALSTGHWALQMPCTHPPRMHRVLGLQHAHRRRHRNGSRTVSRARSPRAVARQRASRSVGRAPGPGVLDSRACIHHFSFLRSSFALPLTPFLCSFLLLVACRARSRRHTTTPCQPTQHPPARPDRPLLARQTLSRHAAHGPSRRPGTPGPSCPSPSPSPPSSPLCRKHNAHPRHTRPRARRDGRGPGPRRRPGRAHPRQRPAPGEPPRDASAAVAAASVRRRPPTSARAPLRRARDARRKARHGEQPRKGRRDCVSERPG